MKKTEWNPISVVKFRPRSLVTLLITLLFAQLSNISIGQTETVKTLKGTFKDKRVSGLNNSTVNHKNNYMVRLDGLNTALYKVQFKFSDFDWESEPPGILEQTIMPGIRSFANDGRDLLNNDTLKDPCIEGIPCIDEILSLLDEINEVILLVNKYPTNIEELSPVKIQQLSEAELTALNFDPKNYAIALTEFQNNIAYLKGLYSNLKEFNTKSPNGKSEYVQLLASLEGIINQLNTKNYPKLLGYIISFAKKAPDPFVESDVHFPEKEVTTLQIIVTDRFNGDTICNYSTDIYRTGIFKIDFSTGIGINSLVKPTYALANNGSPYIHKENGRDVDLSVMALLHANWRLSRSFSFGPTAGVSVSTFDANTGFVFGLSGSFGTRNTVSISTGGIMGKSFKLSSRVSSDGNKADIPLESGMTEIPKVDAVNYGWFVSVTYNLTRIKKK